MGVIANYVKWYLSRPDKYTVDTLQDRAIERFGNVNKGNINREITKQLEERSYAVRASNFKSNAQLVNLKVPGGKDQIRVVYTAKIYITVARGGTKTKYVTFTLDHEKKGTMGGLREAAKEQVKEWVNDKYAHEPSFRLRNIDFDFFGSF